MAARIFLADVEMTLLRNRELEMQALVDAQAVALNRPIRVLVIRSAHAAGGGAEEIILRMCRAVDPAEVRLSVAYVRRSDDEACDFGQRLALQGTPGFEVLQRSRLGFGVKRQLQQVVDLLRPDVIDSHDYKAAYFARRLSAGRAITPIATLHGWTGTSLRERLCYYPAEKLIARTFPRVIAVSKDIRREMIRWRAERSSLRVLLNGISVEGFRRSPESRRRLRNQLGIVPTAFVVGAVGRLERQKRFDLLLAAFARFVSSHPTARLVLVGDGTQKQKLQKLIDRQGLGSVCQLLGARRDVADLYSTFDVMVQSSEYEGTPTVLVEAMAAHAPIVATDAGGTRDLIKAGRHALIVPIHSPEKLADAIEDVFLNRDQAAQRAEAAYERARRDLTFAKRTRLLASIYREAAQLAHHSAEEHRLR
jgi:glycosyltransferase involved in cell wall biosynthesis